MFDMEATTGFLKYNLWLTKLSWYVKILFFHDFVMLKDLHQEIWHLIWITPTRPVEIAQLLHFYGLVRLW